jgi:hypothetical protein
MCREYVEKTFIITLEPLDAFVKGSDRSSSLVDSNYDPGTMSIMEDLRPWEALPGVPLANEQFIGWESLPVDSIRLDPASARVADRYTEPDQSFDQFVASIAKWGIAEDVIVSRMSDGEHLIIDGVRRFRAAIRLGLPNVPCMVYGPMTETERRDLRDVLYFVGMEFKRRARTELKAKRTLRRARDFSQDDGLAA